MKCLPSVVAASAALLAAACSGPAPVRDAFNSTGQLIALGGGSGGATNACVSCHGIAGEGDGQLAPRLAGIDRGYLERQLAFYADGQRSNPQMVAVVRKLGRDERHQVAGYYAALPVATSGACVAAPMPAAQALYRGGDAARNIASCASCHGASGEGNAGNPPLAGQPAAYLARQLEDWRKGERYDDPLGVMTHIGKALTAAESAALSAYASSLPGGRGYPESPAKCPPGRRDAARNGA